jgi:hypothetical protein
VSLPESLEGLRLGALDLVAASGDERALYVATHSRLRLGAPGGRSHQAPSDPAADGDIRWHRLDLGVDARGLGLVDAFPAVVDLLDDAFARSVATHDNHRLLDLRFSWLLELPAPGETYRSGPEGEVDPGRPTSLLLGARAYLDAKGDEQSAWLLQGASAHLEDAGSVLKITLDPSRTGDAPTQQNVARAIVRLGRTIRQVRVGEAPGWLDTLRATRTPR